MRNQDQIDEIKAQLTQLSMDELGADPEHSWSYKEEGDSFILTIYPLKKQDIELVKRNEKEFIKEITEPLGSGKPIIAYDKLKLIPESATDRRRRVILKVDDINLDELKNAAGNISYGTVFETTQAHELRSVEEGDIPSLESLGFGQHFPKMVTDGKWKIAPADEGGRRKVARLVLKLPPDEKFTISLSGLLQNLGPDLNFSAKNSDDDSYPALSFFVHRPDPALKMYHKMNVFYIDVPMISPEDFAEKKQQLIESIQHTGKVWDDEIRQIMNQRQDIAHD